MDESADNLSPASIAGKTFSSKLRGVDATEVQAFLKLAAARVTSVEADRDAWHNEVERLREEVLSLQESLVQKSAEPDEAALTEQLGQEAGRVLTEARAAATDRIAEAEAEAADIIGAAEELYAERSKVADIEAERILSGARTEERTRLEAADDEAGTIRDKAREDAEAIASEAGLGQQAADAEAARIIREAELTRRQILEDLARKRSSARRQIEQLRAGRERLLASHEVVRRTLEEISDELNISMSEARAAAETAGHSVSDSTLEEIEAEIETAKLAGLLDTGPLPVVTSAAKRSRPTAQSNAVSSTPDETGAVEQAVDTSEQPEAVEGHSPAADGGAEGSVEDTDDTEATTPPETAAAGSGRALDRSAGAESVEPVTSSKRPDIEPGSDADRADNDGPLAKVVSLKAVREDVDTDRHPANRRPPREQSAAAVTPAPVERLEVIEAPTSDDPDGSIGSIDSADLANAGDDAEPHPAIAGVSDDVSDPEPEPEVVDPVTVEPIAEPEPVVAEVEPESVPVVAEVEPESVPVVAEVEPEAAEPEERVDSLFARMRQTQDAAVRSGEAEPSVAASMAQAATTQPDPNVLSDGIGRKLKRVLADEQSDVLSTLRAADQAPPVDELLGTVEAHRLRYWTVTETFLHDSVSELAPSADPQAEVERMVDNLRRKIVECVDEDANDTDVLVDRLRSVYREVKTQRIAEHSQIICAAAIELNAS